MTSPTPREALAAERKKCCTGWKDDMEPCEWHRAMEAGIELAERSVIGTRERRIRRALRYLESIDSVDVRDGRYLGRAIVAIRAAFPEVYETRLARLPKKPTAYVLTIDGEVVEEAGVHGVIQSESVAKRLKSILATKYPDKEVLLFGAFMVNQGSRA